VKPAALDMDISAPPAEEAARNETIQLSRLGLLVFLPAYYAATSFGYVYFVQDFFGTYYYKTGYAFSSANLSMSLFLISVTGLVLPNEITRPSNFFLLIGILFPLIPMAVLVTFSEFDVGFLYLSIGATVVMFVVSRSPISIGTGLGLSLRQVAAFSAGLAIVSLLIVGFSSGFQYTTFSIFDVYSNRAALREYSGILAYLINWSRLTLVGIVCAIGFARRSPTLILLGLFLSFFAFVMTAQKSALLLWAVIGGLHLIFAYRFGRIIVAIVLLAMPVFSVAALVYFNEYDFGIAAFRRIYIIPAWLNFAYFDVFQILPNIYWADSSVGFWNTNSMSVSSAIVVGEFLGFRGAHANTGWIGSGFMHAGAAGMLIYAIIIGLVLRMADSFATKIPAGIVISVLFLPLKTLFDSSDVPATFLTYALGPTLVILWCAMPAATKIARRAETERSRRSIGSIPGSTS
jgi:hypothetical protein